MADAEQQPAAAAAEKPTEDVVAKYKRLLSLARSSLEANQATLATKDQQIQQLVAALEEAKAQHSRRTLGKEEEAALVPRRILCRVDVEDRVWALIEYEDYDDKWKSFDDAQALEDFIQRVPGVPLVCPEKCLSAEESQAIIAESKKKVDRVVEEFRRYKVRTEIARKQKDAETRQAMLSNNTAALNDSAETMASVSQLKEQMNSMQQDHLDELQRMREIMKEQEQKWKSTSDKIARENELLRSKGGESLLASQWRGRYEACVREKEELAEKLRSITELSSEFPSNAKSIELAYLEVLDEYRNFRATVLSYEKKRRTKQMRMEGAITPSTRISGNGQQSDTDLVALVNEHDQRMHVYEPTDGRDGLGGNSTTGKSDQISEDQQTQSAELSGSIEAQRHPEMLVIKRNYLSGKHSVVNSNISSAGAVHGIDASGESGGMSEAKLKYLRQMVVRYLSCKEPEVKLHIETALMAIFRLTETERMKIETSRRKEMDDTLSSITNFFGETLSTFSS